MSDIPDDIMSAARKVVIEDLGMDSPGLLQTSYIDCIAEAILEERERSRQLLSEAEKREREAIRRAINSAALIGYVTCAETRHVALGDKVAAAIHALQSKER
ncbi:hypothetical protein [Agrobacterium tumefaciens]|uniref:hypothetical protein n=1 Tax=Agrobacterium tumefaciens TaxID=358 RepID=UPI0028576BB4|nr:hypothetical protein [Agrobacterium tumefaciens]MDR6589505.1 hypothetical protein [Agrobacterium tumefaciens]